jgi:hypothetical protein
MVVVLAGTSEVDVDWPDCGVAAVGPVLRTRPADVSDPAASTISSALEWERALLWLWGVAPGSSESAVSSVSSSSAFTTKLVVT